MKHINYLLIPLAIVSTTLVSQIALAGEKSYIGGSVGVTNLGNSQNNAGAIGKIFGGYGNTFGLKNKLYLGGELNLDLASYPNNYVNGSNFNYALGASFIPGMMVTTDTMIYGRLGLQTNHFNNSGSNVEFGYQLGVGVQTKIQNNWDFRAEYINLNNVTASTNNQLLVGLVYNFN